MILHMRVDFGLYNEIFLERDLEILPDFDLYPDSEFSHTNFPEAIGGRMCRQVHCIQLDLEWVHDLRVNLCWNLG